MMRTEKKQARCRCWAIHASRDFDRPPSSSCRAPRPARAPLMQPQAGTERDPVVVGHIGLVQARAGVRDVHDAEALDGRDLVAVDVTWSRDELGAGVAREL